MTRIGFVQDFIAAASHIFTYQKGSVRQAELEGRDSQAGAWE